VLGCASDEIFAIEPCHNADNIKQKNPLKEKNANFPIQTNWRFFKKSDDGVPSNSLSNGLDMAWCKKLQKSSDRLPSNPLLLLVIGS
jgi:hypothetical protein